MLPKQVLPIFSMTIPSSGKKVNYRQFTVREEKMLTQAQESEDLSTISTAVKEIIKACVNDVDVKDLSLFDIEYIITRIRSKSVGEKIDLKMPCEKDPSHERIPVRINLDEIKVTFNENHNRKIELWEGNGVVMRYPNIDDLSDFENADGIDAIIMCIDYIYTPEEVFYANEQNKEELVDYLESLTEDQLEKIENEFLKTMPSLRYDFTYTCPMCGHTHKKFIKGLSSFFA